MDDLEEMRAIVAFMKAEGISEWVNVSKGVKLKLESPTVISLSDEIAEALLQVLKKFAK